LTDPSRYQTVYAKEAGSAAAPTAGLHFTMQLIEQLRKKGISFVTVTLHIGLDTFLPVSEDDPQNHKIHSEWCEISEQAALAINQKRKQGGRIIAVGTTSVRVLETAAQEMKQFDTIKAYRGQTQLFILPGYNFKLVDGLITNFHLPRSTLLMLVSAFVGRENILRCYEEAKQNDYRFYSFGDAMIIL
jgi:S-adenosylmethionine:tRNA ribosyltransferase-isomerase